MKDKKQTKNEELVAVVRTKEEEDFRRHYEEVSRGFDLPANPFRGPSPGADLRTADAVPLPTTDTGYAMQQQTEFHDTSPLPGIHLLTGISAGVASPEEQALWEDLYASSPAAVQQLSWFEEQTSAEEACLPEAIFTRGAQLLDELPPLGADFWETLKDDATSPQEAWEQPNTIEESTSFRDSQYGLEEPELEEPGQIESSVTFSDNAPLASTERWGMGIAATLLMGFLLIWWNPQPTPSTSALKSNANKMRVIPLRPPRYRSMGAPELHPNPCKGCSSQGAQKPAFEVFRRRDGKIQSIRKQMTPKSGDELRFEYRNPSQKHQYLLVFMIDGKGAVSRLYPSREEVFLLPHSTEARYLPGGAILSPSLSAERLYLCVSSTRITYADVLPGLKRQIQLHGVEKTSTLPRNCEVQRSWLLK